MQTLLLQCYVLRKFCRVESENARAHIIISDKRVLTCVMIRLRSDIPFFLSGSPVAHSRPYTFSSYLLTS